MSIIAKKVVNALVADAEATSALADMPALGSVLRGFKKRHGGLWVGGTAVLTERTLAFEPNAMNRIAHQNDISFEIGLSRILRVKVKRGFITNIIEIRASDKFFALRCFGARQFAESITAASEAPQTD